MYHLRKWVSAVAGVLVAVAIAADGPDIAVPAVVASSSDEAWPAHVDRPTSIAIDPVGQKLYVSSSFRGTVTVLDSRSGKREATIDVVG